jgi:hypothetical protein
MERALEHASRLRHRLRDVELRSDGPDVKGEIDRNGHLSREHTAWRQRQKQTDNTNSNCFPVSFRHRKAPYYCRSILERLARKSEADWMPFYYELFCPVAIFLERLKVLATNTRALRATSWSVNRPLSKL